MQLILEGHAQPISVHPGETILTSLLRGDGVVRRID